jgi:diacylglycerol kinase (ATP)
LSTSYAKVIVNPVAGAGRTDREWPRIRDMFRERGLRFEHDITDAPGHAIELACDAAQNGFDMVVSVGGDGTVNEVVNGLYRSGRIGEALLGIIGTGTGGDYIRTLGVSRNYRDACDCFFRSGSVTVDLGIVEYFCNGSTDSRVFVNFAGMGFDAEIVRRTTRQFKAAGSMLSYLLGTLTTIVTYRNRDVSLKIDGEVEEKRVCTVILNNGRYGGGGMFTAPHADLSDGLLDMLTIDDISKPDLLWSLPRVYKGTHLTHPRVTMKKVKELEISSYQPMQLQADGELIGELPARFRVLPSVLKVSV